LIQDSDDDLITAGRGKVNHLLYAFQEELTGCLHGIQAAIDLGIGHLIVESDSQLVVRAINTDEFDDAAMEHLVEEIKFLVSFSFLSFECHFKSRVCNQAAHELAVLGQLCTEGEERIISSIPKGIRVIVANDLLASE
jgi:hypothetical protein